MQDEAGGQQRGDDPDISSSSREIDTLIPSSSSALRRASDGSFSSYQKEEEQITGGKKTYERHISMEMLEENDGLGGSRTTSRNSRSLFVLTLVSLLIFGIGLGIISKLEGGKGIFNVIKRSDKNVNSSCDAAADPMNTLKKKSSISNLQNGGVATDHPLCSKMGLETLQKGGNAVDAAVTSTLCLGVANPASSGLGGGAFILVHVNRTTEVIDCRETAPAGAFRDMFERGASSVEGGASAGIMGELKGLEMAHRRHGVLPWYDVVDPVIRLAEEGVTVTRYLEHEIDLSREEILRNAGLARLLTRGNDGVTLLRAGDVLKNPKLGATLRLVRDEGAASLYSGARARTLVKEVNEAGGVWSYEDVKNYSPAIRTPLVANVFGYTVVSVPPPSSGGAVLMGAARFLEGYREPYASFRDTLSVHRLVEGMKHVFAMRMSLSDTDFDGGEGSSNATEAVRDLVEGGYMEELRKMTKDDGVLPLWKYGGAKYAQVKQGDDAIQGGGGRKNRRRRRARGFQYLEDHGTSHVSVVDKDRNAVALTSTVNLLFGSKLVSESTGIIFNNEMDDFSSPGQPNAFGILPSPANYIAPHKRPLSSMSPTLTFIPSPDGEDPLSRLHMSLGASGGPKIITATLQVFLNYAALGMSLFDAVSRPRVHDQLLTQNGPATWVDHDNLVSGKLLAIGNKTWEALVNRGQHLVEKDYMGIVQAVAVDLEDDGGGLTVVSDIRKDGEPAGY